jgi:hypothetical protein
MRSLAKILLYYIIFENAADFFESYPESSAFTMPITFFLDCLQCNYLLSQFLRQIAGKVDFSIYPFLYLGVEIIDKSHRQVVIEALTSPQGSMQLNVRTLRKFVLFLCYSIIYDFVIQWYAFRIYLFSSSFFFFFFVVVCLAFPG